MVVTWIFTAMAYVQVRVSSAREAEEGRMARTGWAWFCMSASVLMMLKRNETVMSSLWWLYIHII